MSRPYGVHRRGILLSFLLVVMAMDLMVDGQANEFPSADRKCRASYCSNRWAYCKANCCTCICNHGLVYIAAYDYCDAPLPTAIPPTTETSPTTRDITTTTTTTTPAATNPSESQTSEPFVISTKPNSGKATGTGPSATKPTSDDQKGSGSSTPAVVGGLLGAVAIVVLVVAMALYCVRRRKSRKETDSVEKGVAGGGPTGKGEGGVEPTAPIYAYADASACSKDTASRTESTSSKAAMLTSRTNHSLPYDYAVDIKRHGWKPPLAPRPVSCSEDKNRIFKSDSTSPQTHRALTSTSTIDSSSEPRKSPTPRRKPPMPPPQEDDEAFYHVVDGRGHDCETHYEEGGDRQGDDLYERLSSPTGDETAMGTSEGMYRELTYAHAPRVYQSLVQGNDANTI